MGVVCSLADPGERIPMDVPQPPLPPRSRLPTESPELGTGAETPSCSFSERANPEATVASPRGNGPWFDALGETAPWAIVTVDQALNVRSWNRGAERLFGWTADEALGGRPPNVPPEERDAHLASRDVDPAGQCRGAVETRCLRKDGSAVDVRLWTAPAYDATGAIIGRIQIYADLGTPPHAEATLATRTRQLEAVRAVTIEITRELDLSTLLGLITHRSKDLVGASMGMTRLWDEARQALVPFAWDGVGEWSAHKELRLGEGVAGTAAQRQAGLIVNDFRHSSYATPLLLERTTYTAVLAEPLRYREQLVGVLALAREDGAPFTLDEQEVLRLFAAQAAIAIQNARLYQAAQTEVTERHRAEAALRESEGRLRTIWDTVALGVVIIDPLTHTIVDANPAAATLIGAPRDQLVGKVCFKYICPADKGRCPITDLRQVVDNSERTLLCVDGTSRQIVKSVVSVLLDGRTHLLESFVDITARKESEEALRQRTQQLEAVRTVTEEITHELDLTSLLRLLIARAAELVGAASATVYLWESAQGVMVPAAWHGLGDWQAAIHHRPGQGIAGTIAETRQGLVVNDYRTSRYANPVTIHHTAVTASLGEPLLYRKEFIGAITLNHEVGRTFSTQDQQILRLFAAQAAIAIQNARLYEVVRHELAERRRAEESLRQELRVTAALATLSGPLISPQTSLEAIARLVLDQARDLTASAHGYVATIDPETGALRPHTFTDMMEGPCRIAATLRETRTPGGANRRFPALWGHALNVREAFYTNAPHAHPAMQGTPAGHIPLDRFLSVPVLLGPDLVGQIALANAPTAYTDANLAAITRLAEIFALAIQRMRAEAALRESQAWLQSIFRSAPTGIGLAKDRVLSWANDTLCQMVGYTVEELLGQSARMLYPTEAEFDRVGTEKYAQIRTHGQGTVETRWQRKDGEVRDILLSSSPLDPADWGGGVTFTALDITERKRTEAALRTRTAQLETLGRVSQEIVREMDLSRLLHLIVEQAVRLMDATSGTCFLWEEASQQLVPQAWIGYDDWRAHTPHSLEDGLAGHVARRREGAVTTDYFTEPYADRRVLGRMQIRAAMGEPLLYHERLIGAVTLDYAHRREDFTPGERDLLRVFATQAAIAIENARLYAAAQQALADLQQAQDKLIRTEKLRGLGQMAAGIAHDLNNTLATILGQTELLRLRTHHLEVDEGLQILQMAASDGAQVVRRLQEFARQRSGEALSPCDLALLVPEALELTRPRWQGDPHRQGVVIEAAVALAGLPLIQGNASEIREILTNLIFNAVDAMPSGGQLRFTGRVLQGTAADAPPPFWVELAMTDTGIGMTDEVRNRIFDPFFTTKGLHGTGLGLSVVYGIVERYGGQIDVESAPGQGTTVRIRFRPAAPDAMGSAAPPAPAVPPSRRILLVDDEAPVRETLAALLRARGQTVIEAESGEAGLRCLEMTPVDVVITDLGMPGLTGWEVARGAKARQTDLPVVLLTGWGEQATKEAPLDVRVDRVLAKPVPLAMLLATITELTGRS
jgi:PAS domain S-box-containing protein